MPFGLMNSQATFQRMMDRVLENVDIVRFYVDDVVIFSKDEEDHLLHLKKVFELLEENGLRLRIKKYSFMQSEVELLGHMVDKNGVHVDDHKMDKTKNAVPPSSRKALRSFLGLASYYWRFIPGFVSISKPLVEKTSEKVKFVWTDSIQESFDTLKLKLTTAPVLEYPDYGKPFIVSTDASSKEIGAVLAQIDEDNRENPVHCATRVLNAAEIYYSAFEREALGVIFSLKKFCHYLLSNKFKLYTDHQAQKHVLNMKDTYGRIARWFSLLADYDVEICYRAVAQNAAADYLSRPANTIMAIEEADIEPDLRDVTKNLRILRVRNPNMSFTKAKN